MVCACADGSTDARPLSAQVVQISDPWLISEMLDRKNYPHALDKPTTFPYNFYQGFDQASAELPHAATQMSSSACKSQELFLRTIQRG